MPFGAIFCKLAYESLRREEEELHALNQNNPSARPMSVSLAGEVVIHYLITKEAIRNKHAFRIEGEYGNRRKVDICFLKAQKQVCASFELKNVSLKDEERKWPGKVREDVKKHLDPAKELGTADYLQRYNAVFLFAPQEVSPEDCKSLIAAAIGGLLTNVEFFISESIQLNQVEGEKADCWRQLRVVVFRGTFAASTP